MSAKHHAAAGVLGREELVHEQCDVRAQALAGGVQRGVDRR
jgi:hypothetical protein